MKKIGKYEIVEELGRGGMGVVYRAYDASLERDVALKVIQQIALDVADTKARFYREARMAARLSHDAIAVIYEIGEEDGVPFIAMEYLPGRDLRMVIDKKENLSLEQKLDYARQIFKSVDSRMRDEENTGWYEHTDAEFNPILYTGQPPSTSLPGIIGLRSSDALMHWMEALTELYAATGDASVKSRLEETLKVNREIFFPPDVARGYRFCAADWRGTQGAYFDEISYGHMIEFAWLMVRAQQVLGIAPDWEHFSSLVANCLQFGFDWVRGGLYERGLANQPAHRTDKIWWVQAEGLVALAKAFQHEPTPQHERALKLLLNWIVNFQILPDGCWICSTDAAGLWVNRMKAGSWKAGYHEVRAMTEYVAVVSGNEPHD